LTSTDRQEFSDGLSPDECAYYKNLLIYIRA
jgi:hypothetical protein